MQQQSTASSYAAPLQAGEYVAIYTGSKPKTTQYGDALILQFKIVGGEFSGRIIERLVGKSGGPTSAGARFYRAMTGRSGAHLDTAVGKQFRVEVTISATGWPRVEAIIRDTNQEDTF
jgi:hypothetical protein